ncbi:MAG: class I SAM-dependent methyltransferase [Verrucomicrobia bacterium]|nr:class I SAM-dependent methyltransferase [Verrucomicrobiota bacterium]
MLIPVSASVLEVGCGAGDLLCRLNVASKCGIDLSASQIRLAEERNPSARFFVQAGEDLDLQGESFDYIIVSETINLAADVQRMFERLRSVSHPETRLIVNYYSSLWRPVIWLGDSIGLRSRQPESNWLSREDVSGLLHLTGWELIPYFGEFDPFGDFDLLFGASKINLRILDIPIRYQERAYGDTNIQRWKHGWLLLQMVAFAAMKLKFV